MNRLCACEFIVGADQSFSNDNISCKIRLQALVLPGQAGHGCPLVSEFDYCMFEQRHQIRPIGLSGGSKALENYCQRPELSY